jgi:restriction endonuclease S subunit
MPQHAFSNFIHLLRPDAQRIHPRYLGWLLWAVNRSGRILRLEQQTTQMRNLNFREYLLMPLPIPPRAAQERIAQIFDDIELSADRARRVVAEAGNLKAVLSRDLLTGRVKTL